MNDFFVSDYDSNVYDRGVIKKYTFKAFYYYILDFINFKFSNYLFADTQTHFNYWEKLFGKTKAKVFILPVLANTKIYKPLKVNNENKFTVLFYGTFIPLHGIDKIVRAFKILEDKNLDINLKIIGSGQLSNDIKKLIDELKLKNLEWINYKILEKDLVFEINKADVLLGIFGDSQKAKSVVPNKVYQSLACKKCVITMDSSAVREFFSDDDIFLIKNHELDIANTIELLFNNRKLINKYETNGYNTFLKLYEDTKISLRNFIKEIQ